MSDKIRGALAILVGAFGLFRSYQLWHAGVRGWNPPLLLLAGLVLLSLGSWRLRKKRADPSAGLLE
jgi:LPXTG-motif cell wall-anchored protein